MKALSIRQPWLWAILHAGKRVENRSRKDGAMPQCCSHRGKLLLHASGSMTRKEHREAASVMHARGLVQFDEQDRRGLPVIPFPAQIPGMPGQLHLGGIIGICDIIGHLTPSGWLIVRHGVRHRVEDVDVAGDARLDIVLDLRWWGGGYALVLDNARPLPPVPCKGSRGLWDVPRDVLEKCCG